MSGRYLSQLASGLTPLIRIGSRRVTIQNVAPLMALHFVFIEVPDILISNELLEDMRKLADLYDYFRLSGAD